MKANVTAAAVLAVGLLGGCREDPAPRPFSVRDSAGIALAESRRPAWEPGGGWQVAPVPALVIGDGPQGDLHDVAGAERLSDGTIVVGNGASGEIRFYDALGRLRAVVGGRGEGPGEFLLLQSMGALPGDTVWAYDFALHRVTSVTAEGMTGGVTLRPGLPSGVPVGRLPGGGFLVAQLWGSGNPEAAIRPGVTREAAAFVRYDDAGVLVDTVGMFPGREVLLSLEDGRVVMGSLPFGREASHAMLGGGFVVGDQVAYELRILAADGTLERILRWAGPPLRLRPSEVERWRALEVASVPPDRRASVRSRLADLPLPEDRPAYGPLLADGEGALWVGAHAHTAEVPRRWDVFHPEGRWLGSVEMPAGFRPLRIGREWILGVSRNDLGVERVELRSLTR